MSTIGGSAPSQNTVNYDALLSTTLFNYRKTMVDNIFKSSALLTALRTFGGVELQNGGERIAQPLMYGKNTTAKSYAGFDVIDTTPQDGMTTAFYPWAQIAATIAISRKEERQNSGDNALLNLLKQKVTQAEMSARETLNSGLVAGTWATTAQCIAGNSGKDIPPLAYFLNKTNTTEPSGTGVGSVGNINRNTYDWWRHNTADLSGNSAGQTFNLSVSTWKGLVVALKRMHYFCSRGAGGAPNVVLMNQGTFESYENAIDQRSTLQSTKLGEVGFDTLKLKGAECVWDEQVPDVYSGTAAITYGTAFFLNTDFYKLVTDTQTDWITTPFVRPENQDARVAQILWMGSATSSNQRKLGVAYGISQSIVA